MGATKRPSYRVIAIDSRRARDGRALEILGFYNPLTDPATVQIDSDRLNAWISKGAQPSETVAKLMRQVGIGKDAPTAEAAEPAAKKPRARKPKAETKSTPNSEAKVAE